jgi:DNA-binding NtrC family response regulator
MLGGSDTRGGKMKVPGKHRVLIVDNCDEILRSLEKEFQRAGFETQATWSGHEALEWLNGGDFDVLVVDDYLPDLHHSDFLIRVGRLRSGRPIIVMQDRAPTPADLRNYDSLGATAVVDKRFPDRVRQAVASCCGSKQILRMPERSRPGDKETRLGWRAP